MGLFRKFFKKTNERQDAFHRNLALLVEAHKIDLILDIGANKGQYAEAMFFMGYRGRIVSFEPGISAHEILSTKATGNDLWTVAPRMALGRKREVLALHAFNRTDMNSLLPPAPEVFASFPKLAKAETEETPVERLDDVLKNYSAGAQRIFLKVDTQGFELAVIEGASGCLNQMVMLQLEVPVVPIYEDAPSWMDILLPVHESGFRPVLTAAGYFSKWINGQLDMDIVFTRQKNSESPA